MPDEIDTLNKWVVGVHAGTGGAVFLIPPQQGQVIPPDDALALAAHIVALVEHNAEHTFDEVRAAIESA